MASTLINVALSSIRPAHASYYGNIDENNPVVCAAEKEIKGVLAYFAKKASSPGKTESEACSRGSNWLFDTWNKFEPRLPLELFYNKLIEVGDYLHQHGFYDVASRQCFGRYINTRYKQLPHNFTYDAKMYKETYFDDKQDMQDSVLTAKALLGIYMCDYKSISELDPGLNMSNSVEKIQRILHGLRTFMQCLLSYESLFWILYNCTIVMYQISRLLMTTGNSIKAIEFLLWASVTMETSVPLLGVKYLTWRVTLYSAVCLAYYDCRSGHHAEAFARRALGKLQELSELERLSDSSESVNTQFIFRQATAKMASMVFKRSVYETRRKPKGMLRPKVKNNLKEAAQLTWPRTVTEKLLSEMFEGGAAQFLAILEALSDSHRRTLQTGPSSTDSDLNDVTAELFFAGKEIIAGGGGSKNHMASGADHSVLAGVRHDKSLIQLAAAGEDGVTLISVVRFIKLAFCYEQWSTFNTMLDCALIYIKKSGDGTQQDGSSEHSGTELCLALLLVMERLVHSRSQKRVQTTTSGSVMPSGGDDTADSVAPPPTQGSIRSVQISDDLVNMAETVFYCINEPALFSPQGLDLDVLIDRDMIVDASLLLWQKCKMVFGKFHTGARTDMGSILQKTGSPGKWIHILSIVHSSLMWSGIGAVDPELIAEVSLRLSLALESFASSEGSPFQADDIGNASRHSMYSTTQLSPASQLGNALQIVKDGIESLTAGRSNMATNDAKFVSDISWMPREEQIVDDFTPTSEQFIRDLHVELLTIHHRIALKLINYNTSQQSIQNEGNLSSRSATAIAVKSVTDANLNASVGGSLLSKAILLMQKADQESSDDSKTGKLLAKAASTIQKAQAEEKALFEDSWLRLNRSESDEEYSPIPPPPILLSRSPNSMTFKPAYFVPDGAKVAWYRIFGRLAAGSNVKVRLNDYYLPGTGEEVPAGRECILRVDGLEANQRYLFAVAAYTSDGKLIGGSVGVTGRSIVACHPLSVLSTWGFLAQMSYKLGCLSVSKQSCAVLWNHFVEADSDISTEAWTTTSRQDFALTTYHLDQQVALASSPVLLRHALTSILVGVETAVREDEIYCNKLCNKGPLMPSQISRLRECERMLVAMEIAGWLNDTSMLLQAVVQTYGLIAPIIQADISVIPVLQVASRCHSALQEVGGVLRLKKSSLVTESLHHMVAVLTNYIAKVAKAYGKNQAALSAIESGKQMLRMEGSSFVMGETSQSDEQSSAKRSKSRKGAIPEVISNMELAALEERLAEMSRETRAAGELTGFEEAPQVLVRLSRMKPIVAYRELAKFRRRTRYLEFFVFVLRRALRLQQIDLAIDWSREVLVALHRRNDTFAVNRSVVSKQPGGVAVQGDETRKYAAAVVEFSQDAPKKSKAKQKDKQKKLAILRKRSGPNATSEGQEEAEINALCVLEQHFIEFYRNSVKRRKLRKISADEMPWRADFNHLMALLHYDVFLDKIRDRNRMQGVKTPKSQTVEYLDQGWWSFDTCGTMVVGWSDNNQQQFHEFPPEAEPEIARALEKAAQLAISSSLVAEPVPPPQPTSVTVVADDETGGRPDSGRTQRTNSPTSVLSIHTLDPEVMAVQPNVIIDCFKTSMLSFRRGLVLAHRGKHWTLLQNIAKSLFSCLMSALQAMSDSVEPAVSVEHIRAIVWQPVAMAADLLLDMLVHMQNAKQGGIWPVASFVGDMTSVKGGSSLKFEENVDDVSVADFPLVKKVVMQAIQLLHFESRWENLVDICLRFSALTHDRYSDIITPLLVHAQFRLRERVKVYGGEQHPQSHFVGAAEQLGKKKIDNRDYLRHNLQVNFLNDASSVGVGGHIDPASHDVYGSGRRALALSSVPFDPTHSMELLRVAMTQSQYMSRALQHSRRLLSIYLASQHCRTAKSRKASAKLDSTSSVVEFSFKAEEPHSSSPPDVTNQDFQSTDVIETLATSQLSTVIQSYNRTIELLMSHGERDLVAQASNELADLFYHQGNKRAAHKWWNTALDNILGCKDSLHQWRSAMKDNDNIPSHFLSTCGVWGCLLAISLTCKIGELTAVDVSLKSGCALLAADLVRSIFRSSLPHPTADFDYASYEIVPTVSESSLQSSPTKSRSSNTLKSRAQACSLINGIDIFSDRFRCNLQSLVASVHWLCETLVSLKFSLPALPALTFYQYLATFVCRDLQRSVHCRCQKLSALTDLRMFKEATNEALNLLYGVRLPHPSDVAYRSPDTPVPSVAFNTRKLIEDLENLKVMEVLASKRVSPSLSALYGPHLTCEVTLGQARLLTHLASCITKIPQKPTAKDLQFVSPDFQAEQRHRSQSVSPKPGKGLPHLADDVRSNISAFSTASASKYINKLFTKRDRPVGQQLLKGMLLAVAEHLTAVMSRTFETSNEPLMASELYLLVNCHYLLSEIYQQRQLSTVSAAEALSALKVLQNSSLFDEITTHTTRKLRSALRKKNRANENSASTNRQTPREEIHQVMEGLYRTRLNARLWLDCRLRMCQALATQIKGLGKVGDTAPDSAGLLDHSQVQLYCAEGLAEAEACDDVEMQALFLILGSTLDGISIQESMHMLEDASASLDEQAELSNRAALGLIECTTRFADLSVISGSASGPESIISYKSAHSVLLLKAMQEGEIISHRDSGGELSTVASPPRNIYSTYPNLLAQIKLRFAHAMLQSLQSDSVGDDHQVVAQLLLQARSLSSSFVGRETQLMADIQIELGKVQRMLIRTSAGQTGSNQSKAAHASLREAVKLSEAQTSDLTTVRQAHLETALVDLVTIETKYSEAAQPPTELDRASSSPSVSAGPPQPNPGQRSFSLDVGVVSQPLEHTQAKLRVATALFSAYHAARGNQLRAVLPGNPQVTALTFNVEDKAALPDFVLLDLTTDHNKLPWTSPGDDVTVEPLLSAIRAGSNELTWIHVLMYYVLLQRKCRLSTLVAGSNPFDDEQPPSSSEGSDRMTSFEQGGRTTPVRLPLNSGDLLLRISALHEFLTARLPAYASTSHVPPLPRGKNYAALQWSREPGQRNTALLWSVYHAEGATVDCGRGEVPSKALESVAAQVNALRKRTEEFFGRVAAQAETSGTRRKRSQRTSVVVSIDSQLEEDWKHVLNQISSLLTSDEEPISQMPFDINLDSAQGLVDLFANGCCVDATHFMYKWLVQLLCPA